MAKQMTRREFLDQMCDRVKKLPPSEVILRYVPKYRRSGSDYVCPCPFHNGKHYSFRIADTGPKAPVWKCFSKCQESGKSGISFVMKYENLDYLDAVFKIALDHGIISIDEEQKYHNKGTFTAADRKYAEQKRQEWLRQQKSQVKQADTPPQARPNIKNAVLNAMPKACGLSETHKQHLIQKRGLAEGDLGDYFDAPQQGFPLEDRILQVIRQTALKAGWSKEQTEVFVAQTRMQIHLVPGFFKRNGKLQFSKLSPGIAFIVRNDKGVPVGVHIRRDEIKGEESRYFWFSSSFALNRDGMEGGNSSGSPSGFLWPADRTKGMLFITEGRFKAEQIAKKGHRVVYLAGVGNWRDAVEVVQRTATNNCAYIAFDADMHGNMQVHDSMKGLSEALKKVKIRTFVSVWEKEYGKGFDDLIMNTGDRFSYYINNMPFDDYEKLYNGRLSEALKDFGLKSKDEVKRLPSEKREEFESHIQMAIEMSLSDII